MRFTLNEREYVINFRYFANTSKLRHLWFETSNVRYGGMLKAAKQPKRGKPVATLCEIKHGSPGSRDSEKMLIAYGWAFQNHKDGDVHNKSVARKTALSSALRTSRIDKPMRIIVWQNYFNSVAEPNRQPA